MSEKEQVPNKDKDNKDKDNKDKESKDKDKQRKKSLSFLFGKKKKDEESFVISGPNNFREGVHVTFDQDAQHFKVCDPLLVSLFVFIYIFHCYNAEFPS
jgi:hypothetical protein